MKVYWNGEIPWVTTSLVNFREMTERKNTSARPVWKTLPQNLPKGNRIDRDVWPRENTGQVALLGIEATTNQAALPFFIEGILIRISVSEPGWTIRRTARIEQRRITRKFKLRSHSRNSLFRFPRMTRSNNDSRVPLLARRLDRRPKRQARSPQESQETAHAAALPFAGRCINDSSRCSPKNYRQATRISCSFTRLTRPVRHDCLSHTKTSPRSEDGAHAGVYYNAYSEDLSSGKNDPEKTNPVSASIQKSSLNRFHNSLSEDNVRDKLKISATYRFEFNLHTNRRRASDQSRSSTRPLIPTIQTTL